MVEKIMKRTGPTTTPWFATPDMTLSRKLGKVLGPRG